MCNYDRFSKGNLRNSWTLLVQQSHGQPNNATLAKTKGTNKKYVVPPHHILLNREKKTTIGSLVCHIKNEIALIHFKPQPPALTLAKHVPIVIHMYMIYIIVSYCIQNYGMPNHKWPMMIKPKV
jgi:hypothetical protein